MHVDVALIEMLQGRSHIAVGFGQGVEGYGGVEVVLGMEWHVPHQPAQRLQRQRGAGVAGAVIAEAAAAVLGQQHEAQ